ncbi:MAG: BrnT family toxin [Pyrinomonadaceae bacterium]|nr:BrnT family toxin [Chthoniobacterales bacterium]MBA3570546.1 BrnT family toxin [Pyrinomonadaceae bacterium]
MPSFEFDANKSALNKEKHGLDFEESKELWKGPVFEFPVREKMREMRYVALGKIDGNPYTGIVSYRGATIRIISVRPSNQREIEQYAVSIKKTESRISKA